MNRKTTSSISRARGLTLIELMISLALSLVLLMAASQVYIASKASTLTQDAAARLLENGRAATELLNRNIRMARYFGCAGTAADSRTSHYDTSTAVQSPTSLNGFNQQGIFGVDGTTDEIIVYHALDHDSAFLAEAVTLSPGVNPLKLAAGHGFSAGDMIAMTDCAQADIFNISAVNTGTSPHQLSYDNCATCSHSYLANSIVLRVSRSRYYIATGASGEPSLFVEDPLDGGDTPVELVAGVEDMQITYGIDTDADSVANQYVSPAAVLAVCTAAANNNCWHDVSSVRIAMLLRSLAANVVVQPQTYQFNGSTSTASDLRLRREFLTTIALRNYRP